MRTSAAAWILAGLGGAAWLAVIFLPLLLLYVLAAATRAADDPLWSASALVSLTARTAALAAVVAALAVLVGYVPGRLLGTTERHSSLLFCLTLAPVLLPRYVLYYVWSLLLAPTTSLGQYLGVQPLAVTQWIGTVITMLVLVLWYWPLAALLLAQGWRNLDREVLESAALEAGAWRRLTRVILPMLRGPLALAFAVCFAMVLVEYDTFHLAGVSTIGPALGAIYEQTGSAEAVARASLPLVAAAAGVGLALSRRLGSALVQAPLSAPAPGRRSGWIVFAILIGVSLAAPLGLLVTSVNDFSALEQFWRLQRDGLANSVLAAVLASALAILVAAGVLAAERLGAAGRWLAALMQVTVLVAMFVPGALVGVAIMRMQSVLGLPAVVSDGWWILSAGQAARFAGVALVVLRLSRDGADEHFREMAGADGAGPVRAWLHVHLPRTWPLVVGAAMLVAMFSLTEIPATLVLLPPGVPDFTQRLLNQMHYARDQHVIASCLALVAVYLALAVLVVLLARVKTWRAGAAPLLLLAACLVCPGCEAGPQGEATPHVLCLIGSSGRGPGEFLYPRAIALDAGGALYVADRTGRVQHLSPEGQPLGVLQLPMSEKGYPTGLAVGPDGNLYVADTHYHRVLVYEHLGRGAAPAPESPRAMSEAGAAPRPTWRLVREFGSFGTGDGQFLYPTHVAFAADDNVGRGAAPAPESPRAVSEAGAAPRPTFRIYVSEYGGNDRVSVFTPEGAFVGSFGRPGSGQGEFSRPEALAVDARRRVLYVADACNHRIARYTLEGQLTGYFGSVGQGPGELRYPYGLALLADGTLVVCEYGNNRLQFFGPDGRSLKCLGRAGRAPGELAYPWGVAAGPDGNVYVVDAGNNRVQVWRP
ncbi:MAG: 6-bladed beta-propeller [Planctomycetota bacterium]|nr:6-bladed beta-propeller [Planctomycetota bacterium]